MTNSTVTGGVGELWRYPVKSMLGERLDASYVDENGVRGDRAYALIDRGDGSVASAKNPRKWSCLLECSAVFVDPPGADGPLPPVRISLPGGDEVRSDADDVDAVLSSFIGRDVHLAAAAPQGATYESWWPDIAGVPAEHLATSIDTDETDGVLVAEGVGVLSPPGTFFDLASLHLVTTSTLQTLGERVDGQPVDRRRLRPNVVVETDAPGFAENGWTGTNLLLGSDAVVSVMLPTPRCVMTTLAQSELAADRRVLQAVASSNRVELPGFGTWSCAGAYASVERPGTVAVGDTIRSWEEAP